MKRWPPALSVVICVITVLDVYAFPPFFGAHTDFTAGTNPQGVAIGDLNGDGRADVVVANAGTDNVSVFINTTAPNATVPTFAAKVDFVAGSNPSAVAIADLNGDGLRDVAVANFGAGSVSVLRNTIALGSTVPSFATKQDFTTGTGNKPKDIVLSDVNLDGVTDIVLSCGGTSNNAEVLLNTTTAGATTLTFAAHQDFAAASAGSVAVADLNGDGVPEVVVSGITANFVTVLRNTSAPGASALTFSRADFDTSSGPWGVALGDLDRDGKSDIAIACIGAPDSVSVLLNVTPTGTTSFVNFAPHQELAAPLKQQALVIRDFNGDGWPDIAVLGEGTASVSVFTNSGGALNLYVRTDFTIGASPWAIASGDINGDGRPDLVIANSNVVQSGIPGANNLEVLLNTEGMVLGTLPIFFTSTQQSTTLTGPIDTATADFNGDGKPDVAVTERASSKASVFLNTTAPEATAATFATRQDFTTGGGPIAIRAGDLNGDGRPDLLALNIDDGTVSLLRNTTAVGATVPAFAARQDFVVGVASSSPLRDVAIGEFNNDGKPDVVAANGFEIVVLPNQTASGATAFTIPSRVSFPHSALAIALGDVNGDGKTDIAFVTGSAGVSVLMNLTTPGSEPSFSAATTFATDTLTDAVSFGDLNGDGKADLIVRSEGAQAVEVLLNTTTPGSGSPTFAAHQNFVPGGAYGGRIVVADLDNDGRPDLAYADNNGSALAVFLNRTTPGDTTVTFAARASLDLPNPPSAATVADFNVDGWPDVATGDSGSRVNVCMRTTPQDVSISSGDNQTAGLNTAFAPLKVIVKDANGVPVQLVEVVYGVVPGAGGASGTFAASADVLSGGAGIATAPVLTANATVGPFTVNAVGLGLPGTSATFHLTNAIAAPAHVTASAQSATSVLITWDASPAATAYTVTRYTVYPSTSTTIASNVTSLSATDNGATAGPEYLYSVRAVSPSAGINGYDLATTVTFTDPTVAVGATTVKAQHWKELQDAVNAVEVLANRTPTVFTGAPFTGGVTLISASQLTQLRNSLTAALFFLPVPQATYTQAPPLAGKKISAVDVINIRNAVK